MFRRKIYVPKGEEITKIHDYLVEAHGGIPGSVSDPSYVSYYCENYLKDKGIVDVVSFMLSRISKGHYFIDGNKRTSYFGGKFAAMINGYDFDGTSATQAVSEMEKIAELNDKESKKYARFLVNRDLAKRDCCGIKNINDFERFVLKNIAVSNKLSNI